MLMLLEECLGENGSEAWEDFFDLYVQATRGPLRNFVRLCGGNEQDAEDLGMEVLVRLYGDSCRRLRTFRGDSRRKLSAWLRRVAINHARNWRRSRLNESRYLDVVKSNSLESVAGPTEADISALMRDLSDLARQVGAPIEVIHVERLGMLAGLREGADQMSERTIRHWKRDLASRLEGVLD